jgi:CRP-like cAMP-binding protein
VDVDTLAIDVLPGDRFLLCSDGLHGYLQNEMLEAFLDAHPDPEAQVHKLIDYAKTEGGKDNITVVVVHVEENEQERVRVARVKAKRATMRQMKLFAKVDEHDLLRLLQVAEIRDFAAGATIMREGDPGEELFIVLSGRVHVKKGDALLATLGPGEHVGEMSLIRSAPRSATVVAAAPCEMVVIHQRDFAEMIQREPRLAISVLREFLLVLADRLDHTSRDLRSAKDEVKQHEAEKQAGSEIVDLTESAVLEETPKPGAVATKP